MGWDVDMCEIVIEGGSANAAVAVASRWFSYKLKSFHQYQLFPLDAHFCDSLQVQLEVGFLVTNCLFLTKIENTFSRGRVKAGV